MATNVSRRATALDAVARAARSASCFAAVNPPHDGHWLVPAERLVRARESPTPTGAVARRVRAIAEALFARDGTPPPADRLDWLCNDVDDFLASTSGRARGTFVLALWALTWFAPFAVFRLGPLGRLSLEDRTEALERFERGWLPMVAAILAVKTILCVLYFEHPDGAREIDFDAECKGHLA